MKNSYLIGLTGNLGSGKSTVRKTLEQLGARGIDADALAHTVMARGTSAWRAIIDAFGADILTFNGRIDRQKLGERVFSDAAGLRKLEAIAHPAVGARIRRIVREEPASVIVIEAIKLLEANLGQWCDSIWVVQCAPEIQIQRVMRDRHMSEVDARARLASQSPVEDKLKFANVVIDNSGDEAATRAQVENAWSAIRPETAKDKSAWLSDSPPTPATAPQPPGTQAPAPKIAAIRAADVEIRRARRSDLSALGVALAKLKQRDEPLARAEALRRFGERGYLIATLDNRIVALAAWEAENLVAVVREIWTESADTTPIVLPKLLARVEQEASGLLCEVVLLQIEASQATLAAEALAAGYRQRELNTMHPVWRSVAEERMQSTDQIWLKRLREEITKKPF